MRYGQNGKGAKRRQARHSGEEGAGRRNIGMAERERQRNSSIAAEGQFEWLGQRIGLRSHGNGAWEKQTMSRKTKGFNGENSEQEIEGES